MKLKKTYQDGGKKPQPAQRDTIQKILSAPMLKNGRRIVQGQVDSDQGAIPISEYTPEEMAAYEKYSEETFPFVDFDIHEFVADRRAKQQPTPPPPPPSPQPQRPAPIGLRRMFPNPPPQNQITATDDRQLQEMLMDELKKGRESVRVMKADQDMDTGQTPDYDVFWDDSRKQWSMRDIPQEEKDKYRRDHRVFRSSMSF
jgi:hypothetical protein